jgi:hypothetical protein
MIHCWKTKTLNGDNAMSMWRMPLSEPLNIDKCSEGIVGVWNYDAKWFDSDVVVRGKLAEYEQIVIKKYWKSLGSLDKYDP